MSSTKAGGSSKNGRDSGPQYLGVKLSDGSSARPGMVIVRQRGTKIMAGDNAKVGKDHTLYSMVTGLVSFKDKRKTNFDGRVVRRKIVHVVANA